MKFRDRGFAMMVTLGITTILVMVLSVTLLTVNGSNIFSQDYHGKRAAYYAAESGLATLQRRLEVDTSYNSDSVDEETPFGTGTFTIRFGPDECLNNLDGDSPIAGPYGPIPPGSCFVKIQGQALGHREKIECMLGRKDSDHGNLAVAASGKIHLDGNVTISGRVSNNLLTKTPADVVSNFEDDTWSGHPPLSYQLGLGETARVEGSLRSSSPSPAAITPDFVDAADEALFDQTPTPLENYDIQREVDSKSSNPSPPITSGSLAGDYYKASSHLVPGDLVLDDANLYIDGDLTVIGSITGRGSVYVTGDTKFSGDSIVAANEDGIALYGLGNVSLIGFDGSQYMEAIVAAEGGDYPAYWQQTKDNIGLLVDDVNLGSDDPFVPTSYVAGVPEVNSSHAAIILHHLAKGSNDPHPEFGSLALGDGPWNLGNLLDQQTTSSPAQQFMLEKFRALRSGPSSATAPNNTYIKGPLGMPYTSSNTQRTDDVNAFLENGTLSDGLFNNIVWEKARRLGGSPAALDLTEPELDTAIRQMGNWLENFEYDKLGSSYFQGSIYARGAFYADNQVTIVGSVSVVKDPLVEESIPNFQPATGISLRPGDLYLGNGTQITFVSELAPGSGDDEPRVGVSHWFR
jgi:hypothetical protein